MAIGKPKAIDDAPARGPEWSGGWRRRDFVASRGMGAAQGKKVDPTPLWLRRSRRSRPPARSSQREAVWLARPRTASSGEDVADVGCPPQEARRGRRREGNRGVGKGS